MRFTKYKTKPKTRSAQTKRIRALCAGQTYQCLLTVNAIYTWAHDPAFRLSELAMSIADAERTHATEEDTCACQDEDAMSPAWRALLQEGIGR